MTPEALTRLLAGFLAESPQAVVVEGGEITFDLAHARYSISGERGKCVLHFWSEERNTVRRVLDAEVKAGSLRLTVQRFGQSKPSRLEICPNRDRRTASAKKAARARYQELLGRVLQREFPGYTVEKLSSAADLERSFGPMHARALLRRGQSALAVVGVNAEETQASVDAALTTGILWLHHCREHAKRGYVEGLTLFVPGGHGAVVRERMAHLDTSAARWQLFELEEREREVHALDTADRGNVLTRLVQSPDEAAARARFAQSIARIAAALPEADAVVVSSAEVGFRLHGLQFARARLAPDPGTFRTTEQLVFGVGAEECSLPEDSCHPEGSEGPLSSAEASGVEQRFHALIEELRNARRPNGPRDHPLFRMHPERWLESLILGDLTALDEQLEPAPVYSQVPAFSASDRAMLDVLARTRSGRLAVLELKADEDIHLPLQALDYWARVAWHHQRGEFQRFGYFADRELSPEPPLLLMVAPALRIHPATDTLLRFLSPDIPWTLAAVDEHWREGVRVIFRKRPEKKAAAGR
jgi:hypothetical protein